VQQHLDGPEYYSNRPYPESEAILSRLTLNAVPGTSGIIFTWSQVGIAQYIHFKCAAVSGRPRILFQSAKPLVGHYSSRLALDVVYEQSCMIFKCSKVGIGQYIHFKCAAVTG